MGRSAQDHGRFESLQFRSWPGLQPPFKPPRCGLLPRPPLPGKGGEAQCGVLGVLETRLLPARSLKAIENGCLDLPGWSGREDSPEIGIVSAVVGTLPLSVVEGIVSLNPDLKAMTFSDLKSLGKG